MFAIGSLDGLLAQVVAASGKGTVQLVIQVKAVGQHKQGCTQQILQELVSIEHHRKAFARTLRVPEHTDFAVIALQGFLSAVEGFLYGKILVVASQYACLFIHTHSKGKVGDNIYKPMLGEDAVEKSFKVGKCRTLITSVRGFPLHISVEWSGNSAYTGVCHIAYHKHLTSGKELRNDAHIVLQLLVGFL